ncbi:hypothetical protein M9H77_20804 [Catharanthus roseus]|uniref:Uncharacterized protein n=1 Tax=Catharanthus roseus TaxID=4058 RepID=A0ACC0AL83_CATRO|nr:hypothetical protein M9H77_20804 [Catharanthus roseus]
MTICNSMANRARWTRTDGENTTLPLSVTSKPRPVSEMGTPNRDDGGKGKDIGTILLFSARTGSMKKLKVRGIFNIVEVKLLVDKVVLEINDDQDFLSSSYVKLAYS